MEGVNSYAKFLEIMREQDPEYVEIWQTETKLFKAGLIEIKPNGKGTQFTRKALDVLLASIPQDECDLHLVNTTETKENA